MHESDLYDREGIEGLSIYGVSFKVLYEKLRDGIGFNVVREIVVYRF